MALHGIGLRTPHYPQLLTEGLRGATLAEAISENFMGRGGRPLAVLERVRGDVPVALHGVGLSIGGLDPVPAEYLRQLRALRQRIDACWVSDHFSFGTVSGHSGHDLWPLPFTEESVRHVAQRVRQVQDALGERLVLENVSSYVQYADSRLTEWEFICAVAEEADCELLLDLNNVHVNAVNHGFEGRTFVEALPTRRIRQLHLAGHADCGTHLFDDHGSPVPDPVWALYEVCLARHGEVPSIVEWDENVPALERVLAESAAAAEVEARVLGAARAASRAPRAEARP